MIVLNRLCAALVLFTVLTSCVKKELPVKAHESGNVTSASVNMDASYKYQIFYSLKTNSIVSQNLKTIWDLAFEASAEGYHVVLNTSKSMFVLNTDKTDFSSVSVSDTAGFGANKKWDSPGGSMDSTAFGDWRDSKPVYIVDLGFNELGQPQGMRKVQIRNADNRSYDIRFAALDGSGDTIITIVKDSTFNLAFLSLTNKKAEQVEPPKDAWDLVFTQYTYIFRDEVPPMPYLVTGCLLNRNNTAAVMDTANQFVAITFANVSGYDFGQDISAIGYDWKEYNGTSYTVDTHKSYVIRTADGVYYKLHFTGFYSNTGTKGSPQWEFQKL